MLTLEDVYALDMTLQASGEAISANQLVRHHGGSKREALRLLREYRARAPVPSPVAVLEPPRVPADAGAVSVVPETELPLLAQAEAELREAVQAEHAARRALDVRGLSPTELAQRREALAMAQQAARLVQGQVDKVHRGITSLHAALPGAQIAVTRAAGHLAEVQERTRRELLKAQQAQAELEDLRTHLVRMAGAGAVPGELVSV